MKFRKTIDEKNRIKHVSPSGDPIAVIKGWFYENGDYVYKEKKFHDHYAETQAAKEGTDLRKMIERYQRGDAEALTKVTGFYADMVDMPKTLSEMYDATSNMNHIFDSLPAELKDQFDNNPAYFWKEYGTKDFDTLVNDFRLAMIGNVEPISTVKEVESEVSVDVPESE